MALDYTALTNAVTRLAEGVARYQRDTTDTQIRDGLIQRFEFTYDLSHKLLRRTLAEASANPADIDRMTFPTLIRTGVAQGLIAGDWPSWRTYREMRNISSHSYDEAKAGQIAAAIPEFLEEARALVDRLQSDCGA